MICKRCDRYFSESAFLALRFVEARSSVEARQCSCGGHVLALVDELDAVKRLEAFTLRDCSKVVVEALAIPSTLRDPVSWTIENVRDRLVVARSYLEACPAFCMSLGVEQALAEVDAAQLWIERFQNGGAFATTAWTPKVETVRAVTTEGVEVIDTPKRLTGKQRGD